MRKLLDDAISRGCDATLITSETKDTSVSFDFNRLKTIENTESLNMSLQVIKAGKLGVANSTRTEDEDELLENALNVAEYGSAVSYRFPAPEPHADPRVFHRDVQDLDVNQMISLGDELAGFIKSLDPSIQGSVGIQKSVMHKGH
jgi:predicted Zn-dependent protease